MIICLRDLEILEKGEETVIFFISKNQIWKMFNARSSPPPDLFFTVITFLYLMVSDFRAGK